MYSPSQSTVETLEHRILVVDDELEIRSMLERHLRYEGLYVRVAQHGVEALDILRNWPVGVVVTDLTMPKMGGLKLLAQVRKEHPSTRVIVMTGRTSEASIVAAMQGGADACVLKPLVDLAEFMRTVRHSQAVLAHWEATLEAVRDRARSLEGRPSAPPAKAS